VHAGGWRFGGGGGGGEAAKAPLLARMWHPLVLLELPASRSGPLPMQNPRLWGFGWSPATPPGSAASSVKCRIMASICCVFLQERSPRRVDACNTQSIYSPSESLWTGSHQYLCIPMKSMMLKRERCPFFAAFFAAMLPARIQQIRNRFAILKAHIGSKRPCSRLSSFAFLDFWIIYFG
jgi:hypothetical protein